MEGMIKKLLLTSCILMGGAIAFLPLTSYAATDISDFNFDDMKAQNACRNARTQKLEGDVNGAIVTGEDGKQYIVDGDYRYLYENGTDGSTPGVTSTTAGLTPEKTQVAPGRVDAADQTASDGSTIVCVNVDTVLSLDAAVVKDENGNEEPIVIYPNMPGSGTLEVTVRSAMNYSILLSAEENHLFDDEGTFSIPSVENPDIQDKKYGWGVKNLLPGITAEYSKINSNPTPFYDGEPTDVFDDNRELVKFPIKITVSPKLPQGVYATDLTVTAVTRQLGFQLTSQHNFQSQVCYNRLVMLRKSTLFYALIYTLTCLFNFHSQIPASALEVGDIVLEVRPVEQELDLEPGANYSSSVTIKNGGRLPFTVNLSVLPYQALNENYDPDFSTENSYTNLKNWITFPRDSIHLEPGEEVEAEFHISVPKNIPGGGQYAAIIVQTRDTINEEATFRTIGQIASLLYAHVEGEEHIGAVMMGHKLPGFLLSSPFSSSVTVKNDGNIDFRVSHSLTVYDFFTNKEVFTPEYKDADGKTPGRSTPIILPDTTRTNTLTWEGAPQLGVFRAVQHISFLDQEYTFERLVVVCPIWLALGTAFIVFLIILWIVLVIRGRRGRRLQVMQI